VGAWPALNENCICDLNVGIFSTSVPGASIMMWQGEEGRGCSIFF
jgi:hypothetical protein